MYLVAPPRLELGQDLIFSQVRYHCAREPWTKKGRLKHLPFSSAYETEMSKTLARYWASGNVRPCAGGTGGSRTHYILLAKQTLYRLSYSPTGAAKSPPQSKYR